MGKICSKELENPKFLSNNFIIKITYLDGYLRIKEDIDGLRRIIKK